VLVAEPEAHRIRRIAPNGAISVVAGTGTAGFAGDGGPATAAKLNAPRDIAVLPGGGFLVADTANERVRRVAPDGTITTVAGGGLFGWKCPGTMLSFGPVDGVAVAGDGGFAALTWNGVYEVAPGGSSRWIGRIRGGGGIAYDEGADLLVSTGRGNRLYRFERDGTAVERLAGTGEAGLRDGSAVDALFNELNGIAPLAGGRIMLADSLNSRLRDLHGSFVNTYAGDGGGYAEGTRSQMQFRAPFGVSADPQGGLLVADTYNDAVRRVADPNVTPLAPPATTPPGPNDACRGLDTGYGSGGLARPDVSLGSHQHLSPPNGFVTDGQGRLAAAVRDHDGQSLGLAVHRLTPDGRPDAAFGGDGTAFLPLPDYQYGMNPRGLALLPDGRYVAAATAPQPGADHLIVAAFTPAGVPDPGFGAGGRVVLEQTGGGVVVAGPGDAITVVGVNPQNRWVLTRLDARGRMIGSFGTAGSITVEHPHIGGMPSTGHLDAAGRLVVAGGPRVVRFLPDGSLDPAWGDGGRAQIEKLGLAIQGLAPLPDGRVYVAGRVNDNTNISGYVGRLTAAAPSTGRSRPARRPCSATRGRWSCGRTAVSSWAAAEATRRATARRCWACSPTARPTPRSARADGS
jgi:uncharacterized delta-60 repeat protein